MRMHLTCVRTPCICLVMDGALNTNTVEVLELLNPRAIKRAALEHFEGVRFYNSRVGSFEEYLELDPWGFFLGWLGELGELGDVFPTEPSGLLTNAQRAAWVVFSDECDELLSA